jgi:ribosomal protein S18 acetylase RimI-like enzyme
MSPRLRCSWPITSGVSSHAHAIRPIRPSDKSALQRFHARLSPDALYRRYHGIKGDLTPADLRFLTEIDEVTHIARVAVDDEGEIDAVARVVDGEIAVIVADGRRRAGLGQRVACAVLAAFRERGRTEPVTAYVQADNGRALRLFARLGARRRSVEPGGTIELVIPTENTVSHPTGVTSVTRMDRSRS